MMIENFSFNTTNGKTIMFNNKTIEEIADGLQREFPKWNYETCMKMAKNKNFYTMVIPITKAEKPKKERVSFKTPIMVDGIEVNELLRLGKSLCAYHRNGYRQWGVCINEIFDDWKITPTYNQFEIEYERLIKNLKADTLSGAEIKHKILSICNHLLTLKKCIIASKVLNEDGEFIHGVGRRLGLKELMERVETITTELLLKIEPKQV